MHGEYKVPRGKLVVVDLDVTDGVIHNVRLTGDFFLYPDEALAALAGGLEGAPAGAGVETYRELVDHAIPDGAELVGFSAQAVAIAAVRAQRGDEEETGDGR